MATCLFDANDRDSREHLFPDWLNREFPNPTNQRRLVTQGVDGVVTTRSAWKTAFLRIKCVCRRCNNEWMSVIESTNKRPILAMIRGEALTLDQIEQLDLGTWAALKSMVFEAEAHHDPVFTEDDRRLMKSLRRAPAHVRVYIGAHADGDKFAVHRKLIAAWRTPETAEREDPAELSRMSITTFVMGHLVLVTIARPDSDYRPFASLGIANDRARTIVPPVVAGATFPPSYLMDDAALDEFANSHYSVRNPQPPRTYPGKKPPQRPGGLTS